MIVCIAVYLVLLLRLLFHKKKNLPMWTRNKNIGRILFGANTIALFLFIQTELEAEGVLQRNTYGGARKTQEYRVSVDGAIEDELVVVDVEAQEYSEAEVKKMFQVIMQELDRVVLGENETRNHVETDLNFVKEVGGYPVLVQWEVEPFGIVDAEGKINQEKTVVEGSLVKATATISYAESEARYVANFMVYPKTKTEREVWLEKLESQVTALEESTREQETFVLPQTVDGKHVEWSKKEDTRGYEVLTLGGILCLLLIWRQKQDEKETLKKRQEQMMRDYPEILSNFTLLLGTGMTLKSVWKKIVENYEGESRTCGKHAAYEEMCVTCHEMNNGIAEAEAYERFGKRCGVISYMKLGALLSQNLRKGSKGLAEILSMESLQAFEQRKNEAKRLGEEAGTKLLLPMFTMLAVVMVIVIVPAFLSIQL